jgi:hypothetical protein
MFGFRRGGFPLFIPLLIAVAFGYMLAGGVGSVVGALLFLPLLIMKVLFMLFLFGMLFRFAGGGPWADRRDRTASRSTTEGGAGGDPGNQEGMDWEEAVRAAKREIDRLFPDPKE